VTIQTHHKESLILLEYFKVFYECDKISWSFIKPGDIFAPLSTRNLLRQEYNAPRTGKGSGLL
jgi:hypothetical protein